MKSALTIAPPPPARRHRPLPVEPFVFALLLMVLTLGINVALHKDHAAGETAHKAQPAPTTQSSQVAQAN